jgi:hypothetical protein
MSDKILEAEIEILKQVPHDKLWDFIEKNGERLRTILSGEVDERDREEIENLILWYREI